LLPSEQFLRQVYVTYWYEKVALQKLLELLPVDHVLFETDFPHTACLYENIQEIVTAGLDGVSEEVQRKFLWENSARLYGLDPPPSDAPAQLSLAAAVS
jgi:predicted TIM-barrel fold metal-dependent hydrolase